MAGKLVPELHDIGKLVDWQAVQSDFENKNPGNKLRLHDTKLGHHCFRLDLAKYNFTPPETRTWLAILFHMYGNLWILEPGKGTPPKELAKLSKDELIEHLLVMMADKVASSTSRTISEDEKNKIYDKDDPKLHKVAKIWAVTKEDESEALKQWSPILNTGQLQGLFDLLTKDIAWEDFCCTNYRSYLEAIPEDIHYSRACTTLMTHMMLTGKIFSVINNAGEKEKLYLNSEARNISEAEQKWTFRLARCKVTFPQRPSRAHDLGIFLKLQELMQKIERDDHVLMHTLDSLWIFLPVEEVSPLNKALNLFLDAGFIVETTVAEAPLAVLSSDIFEKHKDKVTSLFLYPEMLSEFPPRICELCQMRPASPEPVIDEKSDITEHLCQVCKGFRKLSKDKNKFRKLGGEWEESDIPVAWVKVSLDYKRLPCVLTDLFKTYLREKGRTIPEQEIKDLADNLRNTALMVDFTSDYSKLLSAFSNRLREEMDVEDIGGEHPELLVVALKEKGQVLQIADIFIEEFHQLFPKCENDSPISLSISVSNVKYPFFEHWRFLDTPKLDTPKKAINIQVVNRGRLKLSVPRFRILRNLEPEKASAKLHRAVAVGARTGSELMAKLEFLEDLQRYPGLHKAHIEDSFSINELLSFQKIADIGGQS